ncbi:MAG: hypothetical protein KZQ81_12945 [Candidatus Thiodiazotropha sp. (ex Rostrolucina anterorostrata)]|nr:hypothetical protein [Candidatus Thiodiazotropha sp. (ex Rostrolucina anterorostrata)]
MRTSLLVCGGALWLMAASVIADYPIAGIQPSLRPSGAPIIEWVNNDKAWYQHALTGIQQPYPRSLYFLDNQGNWYTPFNHPGMTGSYDLRGWHP